MKILVNATPMSNLRTGIGRYVKNLYRVIADTPGVSVAYYDGKSISSTPPEMATSVERWSLLTKIFWMLPLPVALAVRNFLQWRRERSFKRICSGYDLYHETAFFPYDTPADVKTVLTVHDLGLIRHPQWHPAERVAFFQKNYVKRLKWVDGFLAVSNFTSDEMQTLLEIPRESIQTTPLGIDCDVFFEPDTTAIEDTREKYGLPVRYYLCVGSGDPRKNVDIVRAALRSSNLSGALVHAGWSGWEKDVSVVDSEIRLGYVPDEDLPALYAGAQAFIYPSFYEGFGLPILEAMACGCPVVTSRLASLPEVAGDAALYLNDPHDAEELADILKRIDKYPSLRDELIAKGHGRVEEFSWKRTAEETLAMFEKVLTDN